MRQRSIEIIFVGLLFGGMVTTLLCMLADYDWTLSLQYIRQNPDIFMNQYLKPVLLLCVATCGYAGWRLFGKAPQA